MTADATREQALKKMAGFKIKIGYLYKDLCAANSLSNPRS